MGLFDRLKRDDKLRTVKDHFRNLIYLSAVDGKIDRRELEFLSYLAFRWGLTQKELEEIIKEVLSKPEVIDRYKPPKTNKEKLDQLFDLIGMMMADGEIDQRELDFCMTIAVKMGLRPSIVPQIIMTIVEGIKRGETKEEVEKKASEKLRYFG